MPIRQLRPAELQAARLQGEALILLDVREAVELRRAALPDVVHIPLGDLPRRHQELATDARIVCLCHHGVRSMHAALFLESRGFTALENLAGGIDRYSLEVGGVPRY